MRGVILGLLAAAIWGAPAQAAPRFNEIRLSTGVRLHYAEEGPANGSPVIMLHGLSDSWFSFSKVMPLLGKRHRVYALDLRGHGNSDKPATGYHMRNLAEDVVAFMDAQKIARATIVGHSMGSFVAQQVALAAPQRVSRLVLVGSGTTPNEFGGMQEFYEAAAALPEPVPEAFARDFQVSTIYRPVGDAFLERAIDESLKLPSRVWRELVKGMSATDAAVGLGRLGLGRVAEIVRLGGVGVEQSLPAIARLEGLAANLELDQAGVRLPALGFFDGSGYALLPRLLDGEQVTKSQAPGGARDRRFGRGGPELSGRRRAGVAGRRRRPHAHDRGRGRVGDHQPRQRALRARRRLRCPAGRLLLRR